MIDTGDLRKGITFELDGRLVKVVDFSHNKQGRGSAQVRMTLRDLRTGSLTTHTVQAGAKFPQVRLERQHVQYLYADGDHRHFMDIESFDQIVLDAATIGESARFIRENDVVDLLTHQGEPLDIELPPAVILAVTETDPGLKGDTASGATKPATVETGLVVNVPLFINVGDTLKIDTRSGEYIERVN
ncbi:MAG: translation elongation factor [Thermomicrobiales bacterium]|jgi:elongation factor P|nr:translation elongation factor [Thermomicrobiales bacterium]MDF3037717.1 translation elongation factor [Thermomicrobiales bacterium]